MVNSMVDTWNESSSKAAAIERTIRRQYLLRGYEMVRGGERLGPEQAVTFLEEHAQAVEEDIKESTREERHEMRQMILKAGRPDLIEDNMKAIAKKMVQAALPNWQSVHVDNLLKAMRQEPGLWGVRSGGRRGVAFVKQNARGFWDRLLGRSSKAARVCAYWEDGTTSVFQPDDTVEWCILPFPNPP